jgi:hypothetical protein
LKCKGKTLPPIIWIFTKDEGDGIESRRGYILKSTLLLRPYIYYNKKVPKVHRDSELQKLLVMDHNRDGGIQGRSLVFLKTHCPCILPSLT